MNTSTASSVYCLPNLPGFKTKDIPSGTKYQSFTIINGSGFLRDDVLPIMPGSGGRSLEEGSMNSFTSSIASRGGSRPTTIDNCNVVLTFQSYFEESADTPGNKTDQPRIRKCNIYYYVEDGTLCIVERPQLNSGIPQGTVVRRSVVPKPDGSPIGIPDFRLGDSLDIFGRWYRLVDCDASTRKYLRRYTNREEPVALSIPTNPYDVERTRVHAGQTSEIWNKYHSKMNPNKKFMEAQLGNTVNNGGRLGFTRYGNKTLKFHCVWDNTANLYGDRVEFSFVYFLCDDTVEIFSQPSASGAKEQFSRLLKRCRLPKTGALSLSLGDVNNNRDLEYYHWSDFFVGLELTVYARTLRVAGADNATRAFYEENGSPLAPLEVMPEREAIMHEREIPAPTGFGSEEDSLRSCTGPLIPGPAPAKKLGENKQLSFFASLLSGGPDDADRRFVVQYYAIDGTFKVVEPPVRNSGFVGGVFLSRRQLKADDGKQMNENALFVGCQLKILKHVFYLWGANEGTLNWMESKKMPKSSYYAVLDKFRPHLIDMASSGELADTFRSLEEDAGRGQSSKDSLKLILEQCNRDLIGNEEHQICEHELLTILRANGNKNPTFSYEKLIEQMLTPTDEFA